MKFIGFFMILLSNSFAANQNQITKKVINQSEKPENDAVNFKLKKTFDIQIEGKNINSWDKNLNGFINEQIFQDNKGKSNDWIPKSMVHNRGGQSSEIDTRNGTSEDDLNLTTKVLDKINPVLSQMDCEEFNNAEVCKRSVGLTKSPSCQFIEDNHFYQVISNKKNIPKSCKEIQKSGQNTSGIYEIQTKTNLKPFMVFCDMETRGGGWTVILNRFDGSEDFYREWRDYKFGFGTLAGEYWIGLENIYQITGFELSELLVEITDRDNIKAYAHYERFGIGAEKDGYPLNILNGFSGDAGDSLIDHFNQKFTTKDMDQDLNSANCAEVYRGAWWYKDCHVAQLTGKYINLALPEKYKFQGIHWIKYRGHEYCHAGARMMLRPFQS